MVPCENTTRVVASNIKKQKYKPSLGTWPTKSGFSCASSQALEATVIVSVRYEDVAFPTFVFHLKGISRWQGYRTNVRTAATMKVCLSCSCAASTNSSAITVPV